MLSFHFLTSLSMNIGGSSSSSSGGDVPITVSTFYNYTPTEGILIAATVIFGLETVALFAQFLVSRAYFLLWVLLFCASEAGGYLAFIILVVDPTLNAYLAELIILILAPNLVTLVDYTVVSRIVPAAGFDAKSPWTRHGRLIPIVFLSSDLICLILQGIGGSQLSQAHHNGQINESKFDAGRNLTLAGIAAQLFFQSVFGVLSLYLYRHSPDLQMRHRLRWTWLCVALTLILVSMRNIYRIVEFSGGQYSAIDKTGAPYFVLDTLLMAIVGAVFVLLDLGREEIMPAEVRNGSTCKPHPAGGCRPQ